jgi:hypothetical protein
LPSLTEINLVARTSGNDVILDALLLRLHKTECRRGGAIGLWLMDLDVDRGLGPVAGESRGAPVVTLDLTTALAEHGQHRGAVIPADALPASSSAEPTRAAHPQRARGLRAP